MENDQIFRWIFIMVMAATLGCSAFFRRRARQGGEVIPRAREGKSAMAARLLLAAPLYLSMIAYMVNPKWMAWSSLPFPSWLRWLGGAVAIAMALLLFWVLKSLGRSISETYLTKDGHQLVTHGPYKRVRHPLYSAAATCFTGLGVMAANWFIIALALSILIGIRLLVIPKEEAELTKKFGTDYREYMERTGRLVPQLPGRRRE